MKVLFFAQSRQLAKTDHYLLQTDRPLTQARFWALIIEVFPALVSQEKTARLARNETYVRGNELLHPEDEIAVIPPVSGG